MPKGGGDIGKMGRGGGGVNSAIFLVFLSFFFEKITKFLRIGDGFSIKKFFSRFPRGKSLLNFLNLKILNLLIIP